MINRGIWFLMKSASPQSPLVNPFLSSFTFSSDSSATNISIPSLSNFSSILFTVSSYFINVICRMVGYRHTTHLYCSRKRHAWVTFSELKYLCQWTQYRHIPQCCNTSYLWSIYTVQSTLRLVPPQLHCGLTGPKWILIHPQALQSQFLPWCSCGARGVDGAPLFGSSSRSWAPAMDGKHVPRAGDLLLCTEAGWQGPPSNRHQDGWLI